MLVVQVLPSPLPPSTRLASHSCQLPFRDFNAAMDGICDSSRWVMRLTSATCPSLATWTPPSAPHLATPIKKKHGLCRPNPTNG